MKDTCCDPVLIFDKCCFTTFSPALLKKFFSSTAKGDAESVAVALKRVWHTGMRLELG